MKCVFWNIRGLNHPGRNLSLGQLIRENHLDFVGVQETKKEDFHPSFLKILTSPINFCWHFLAANGTAGGVLICVREDVLSVVNVSYGKYSVSCMIQCVKIDFSWKLIVVYGSPYDEGKTEFIDELHMILGS
jgi:exonuclease III